MESFNESNRVVIRGILDNGEFRYINMSEDGHIEAEIHGPTSAFGEVSFAQNTPVFQADASYGLSSEHMLGVEMGGGSVTGVNGMWLCD